MCSRGAMASGGAHAVRDRLALKAKNPELKKVVHRHEVTAMNRTTGGIGGVLDTLTQRMTTLDSDIKADGAGKKEYDDQLDHLRRRKDELKARVAANEEWAKAFDTNLGPFQKKYEAMTHDMSHLYDDAKKKHQAGLNVLIKEFRYHPAYKRPGDGFSATPFRPM